MSDSPETKPPEIPELPSASSGKLNSKNVNHNSSDDPAVVAGISSLSTASGPSENSKTIIDPVGSKSRPSNITPADPFDPMNLGISTDYAAAINAQTSAKPFELRKPNDQEFFRTSPRENHHLPVVSITDKQEMGRVYIVSGALREAVMAEFPRAVRATDLVLTQILAGASLVWPVPRAEDRGGKWHSSQRAACDQGKTRWTNMAAGRGLYEITTVNNQKEVDWDQFPPFREIIRQAAGEGRLIDSLDHSLLKKLRGEVG
jgi:hypothetical protein